MTKVLEKIFSIKNQKRANVTHKVVTILGAKIKINKKHTDKFFAPIKKAKNFIADYKLMHDKSLDVGIPDDITLQLMFNNDCNCRCKFCSAYNENKQKRQLIPETWLYEYFKPIYPKVKNLVPTYGEITYVKEGYEYISWICKNFPHINIVLESNGILFDKKWQELATDNLFSVNFSVNAIDENGFKKTVWDKDGVFPVVKRNIESYLDCLKQRNLYQFKPSISSVLNSTNYEIVADFVKMALGWGLQKIIFFFDTRENNMSKLSVKDRAPFDDALLTLLELEKLLKDKVRLSFRLFIPINNLFEYEKRVDAIDVEVLKEKYKDIWNLAKDMDFYSNYLLKKNEYTKMHKNITYYEDLTGVTYHQTNYNNKMICMNAWNHLRLRPDGCMSVCSWRGYSSRYKIQNYIEANSINFKKLFNDKFHRRLRFEYRKGNYIDCMKNCPSAISIKSGDFKKMYKEI